MPLEIEVRPEIAERLRAKADLAGMTLEAYAEMILEQFSDGPGEDAAPRPDGPPPTFEEWEREFNAFLAETADIVGPEIPMEMLRREHLYEDRGS